jgi:hypothetical protein
MDSVRPADVFPAFLGKLFTFFPYGRSFSGRTAAAASLTCSVRTAAVFPAFLENFFQLWD